jgi:hypothetical protein
VPSLSTKNDAFASHEQLFDHETCAGLAEALVDHHGVDFCFRTFQIVGDHHALAGSKAVGFEHDRKSEFSAAQRCERLRCRIARSVARGRYVIALHEVFREHLARFEPRRALTGTEQQIAFGREHVGDAATERQFRSDDREIDLFTPSDLSDRVRIRGRRRECSARAD